MTDLNCDLASSVPDWVIEYPQAWDLFRALGIECSCGGVSLEYACQQKGLDVEEVMSKLLMAINGEICDMDRIEQDEL